MRLWLCWNVGSVAGALLGAVLGTPESWGLDARAAGVAAGALAVWRKAPLLVVVAVAMGVAAGPRAIL